MTKRINLDLKQPENSAGVLKALGDPLRLKILSSLLENPDGVNITELAKRFDLPLSSAALQVRRLEKAGIISIHEKPGLHGAQKLCTIAADDVHLNLSKQKKSSARVRNIGHNMALGNYFDCFVTPSCGMSSSLSLIGILDSIDTFHHPDRLQAQIIWFTTGFLEYRFPNHFLKPEKMLGLCFSFEACSEAPGYNNDWPSDITIWINHKEVFTFHSAGDFGGRRGRYNPEWWTDAMSQYGEFHQLEINHEGCYGDHRKTSDHTLESLAVAKGEYISFRIGVKEDAEYPGGVCLFGEKFGDYQQNIEMRVKLEI